MPGLCDSNVFLFLEMKQCMLILHSINNHIVNKPSKEKLEIFLSALVIEKNLLLSHYL
jgi:hypothetical protein